MTETTEARETARRVRVRAAHTGDREFILALVYRLAEFGPPPWHDPDVMTTAEQAVIARALASPADDEAIFVAEDREGRPLGFVHVVTHTDYFTRERHGHVSALVVAPAGERSGAGGALMQACEQWSHARRYTLLTLNVFAVNTNAIKFYERLGYAPDTFKYAKQLGNQ